MTVELMWDDCDMAYNGLQDPREWPEWWTTRGEVPEYMQGVAGQIWPLLPENLIGRASPRKIPTADSWTGHRSGFVYVSDITAVIAECVIRHALKRGSVEERRARRRQVLNGESPFESDEIELLVNCVVYFCDCVQTWLLDAYKEARHAAGLPYGPAPGYGVGGGKRQSWKPKKPSKIFDS